MCNIAGYVGTKQAAPILLEMMKHEEGFAGGYNTGIATIYNGNIYHAKLVGSTQKLIDETDAMSFKGTIGICHSRSISHGGKELAHPFVALEGDKPVCAYIANGNPAKKTDPAVADSIANQLFEEGYQMLSRVVNSKSKAAYPHLKDGSMVHSSDVVCQLTYKYLKSGIEAPQALENTFFDLLAERVGLFITLDNPNAIAWARNNMPVFVAFADHGAYIASTPLAFPDDAGEPQLLYSNSCGWLYADKLIQRPFKKVNIEVPFIDANTTNKGYEIIISELQKGPKSFNELLNPLASLYEGCECMTRAALIYSVLYSLKKQNKIKIDTILAEPIFEGIDVPKFVISFVN